MQRFHTMKQVTIAAIDGGCAGAGMGWATACDLRFASTRARFSTAFLNVGVSGDMGLVWGLTRLFEPEALHEATIALAEGLALRDPPTLRLMKANCVSAETLPIGRYIDVETARHLQTTDRAERGRLMAQGYARRKER